MTWEDEDLSIWDQKKVRIRAGRREAAEEVRIRVEREGYPQEFLMPDSQSCFIHSFLAPRTPSRGRGKAPERKSGIVLSHLSCPPGKVLQLI